MIIFPELFRWFTGLQVWWPEDAAEVARLLTAAPLVSVMQCNERVAEGLRCYAFRYRPFQTLLIDLALPEPELWRRVHQRYRSVINRGRRLACRVLMNEQTDAALELINAFMQRRRFRPPLSAAEWEHLREHCDVFLAKHDGRAWAAGVVLLDPPHRARLVYAATSDRSDPRDRSLVGPFNRYLFWQQFVHYQARGIRWYDFGGLELNPASPLYSISRFKLSFGGTVVTEHKLRLAGNPLARSLLRGAAAIRATWRACRGPTSTTRLGPPAGD